MTSKQQMDTDAVFEQLFRDYRQPILNYIYRLIGDGPLAEELTQNAFVKAYAALARLPEQANLRAWLYRIATNVCYDHLRRRRLVQWLPLQDQDGKSFIEKGPEHRTTQEDAVQSTLVRIPQEDRAILILYSVEGYSTADIGAMWGISPGAVKTRLCRARERFRQAYREES